MALECVNKKQNEARCNCTYPCSKKEMCCECLHYHLAMKQLPACCFPDDVEKTFDRSFKKFIETWSGKV